MIKWFVNLKNSIAKLLNQPAIFVVDFVEDTVKHRLLFPFAALFLLVFACCSLFQVSPEAAQDPSEVAVLIEPSRKQFLSPSDPNPRTANVRVNDQEQYAIEYANVQLVVESIKSAREDYKINCDTRERIDNFQTLDDIRISTVCKLLMYGYSATADDFGKISFSNFTIESGPEGAYTVHYSYGDTLSSSSYTINCESSVALLEVLNLPPKFAKYGVALDVQPQVRLTGFDGNPIKGKQVTAISWPEPILTTQGWDGRNYAVQADKFALLANDISGPSDENGVATFSGLTVLASSSKYVYLIFVADAAVYQPWQPTELQELPRELVGQSHLAYFRAITMHEDTVDGYLASLVQSPSAEVLEGVTLPIQPKIRVTDPNGNPVSGLACIATIVSKNGEPFAAGYEFLSQGGKRKTLLRPIAADYYNLTDDGSIYTQKLMDVRLTNSNGELEYADLAFSVKGNVGDQNAYYGVVFKCGPAKTSEVSILVSSSVQSIELFEIAEKSGIYKSDGGENFDHTILARYLNANGEGVPGKYVSNISLFDIYDNSLTSSYTVEWCSGQGKYISDKYGFSAIYMNYIVAPATTRAKLNITVDGISVMSQQVIIDAKSELVSTCARIYMSQLVPSQVRLNAGDALPDFVASVVNAYGGIPATSDGTIVPIEVKMKMLDEVDSLTRPPSGFSPISFSNSGQYDSATSDSYGVVTFASSKEVYGPSGVYYFQLYSDDCVADQLIKVEIVNSISEVVLVNDDPEAASLYYRSISTDTNIALTFAVYDESHQILANYLIKRITLDVINTPPSYLQKLSSFVASDFVNLVTTSGTTDALGQITVNFNHKDFAPGKWAIAFSFNGVIGRPVTYTTSLNVNLIQILAQPADGTACYISHLPPSEFQVQISVDKGAMDGYVVVAMLHGSTSQDVGSVDIYSTSQDGTDDYNSYLALSPTSVAVTDASGVAHFTRLTVIDMEKQDSSFYYTFVIGEPGLSISSVASNKLTYNNPFTLVVDREYSKRVMSGLPFYSTINMTIVLDNPGTLASANAPFVLRIGLIERGGTEIASSAVEAASNQLLAWRFCYFVDLAPGKTPSGNDICEITLLEQSSDSLKISIAFVQFIYAKIVQSDQIKVKVGPPLYTDSTFISGSITLFYKALSMWFYVQPPAEVEVGEIFRVGLYLVMENDKKVDDVLINCNITQMSLNRALSNQREDLMYLFSTSSDTLGATADVFSNFNAVLHPDYTADYSVNGYADIELMFSAAVPGSYSIVCQSGGLKSEPSRSIVVTNGLHSVRFVDTEAQSIEVSFSVDSDSVFESVDLILNQQPRLKMLDKSGNPISGKEESISLIAVDQTSVDKAISMLEEDGQPSDVVSFYNITVAYSLLSEDSAIDQIKKLWRTLSSGVQAVGTKTTSKVGLDITYSAPKYNDGIYTFNDVQVTFPSPGTYKLIAIVDGIETKSMGEIVVEDSASTFWEEILSMSEEIMVYLILALTIFINMKYTNRYFTFVSIPIIILEIVLVSNSSDNGTLYQVFADMSLIALLWVSCYLSYREFINNITSDHRTKRDEIFREYSYQALFHRFSAKYKSLAAQDKKRKTVPLAEVGSPSEMHVVSYIGGDVTISPTRIGKTPNDPQATFKDQATFGKEPTFDNPKATSAPDRGKDPVPKTSGDPAPEPPQPDTGRETAPEVEKDMTLKQKLIKIFKKGIKIFQPFEREYEKRKPLKEMYYFPQRFIFAIMSGLFTLVFGSIKIIQFFLGLLVRIKVLKNDVEKQLASFLMTGITRARSTLGLEFEDKDISHFFDLVDTFLEQMELLYVAIKTAFILGCVLAIILFIYSFAISLFEFRNQVELARKGQSKLPCWDDAEIKDASDFPGLVISNCIIGFVLISGLVTLLFAILFHKLLWQYIFENWKTLLYVLIPIVINLLISVGLDRYVYMNEERIRARGIVQIVDFITLCTSVLEGVAVSIGRFLVAILILILGMTRIDRPILPEWVLEMFNLDGFNKSYVAVIKLYHTFNHPIAVTFTELIKSEAMEMRKRESGKALLPSGKRRPSVVRRETVSRAEKKLHIVWIIAKCKKLRKLRKQKLLEAMEKAAEEKKASERFERAFGDIESS